MIICTECGQFVKAVNAGVVLGACRECVERIWAVERLRFAYLSRHIVSFA